MPFLMEENTFRLDWVRDAGAWTCEDFSRLLRLVWNTDRKFYPVYHITFVWKHLCFYHICRDVIWWFLRNQIGFVGCFNWMKCLLRMNKLFYALYCTFWCQSRCCWHVSIMHDFELYVTIITTYMNYYNRHISAMIICWVYILSLYYNSMLNYYMKS